MNTDLALNMLCRWARAAEQYWYDLPETDPAGNPLGCYGSGYNSWGVQTNQKYVGAMASLARAGDQTGLDVEWVRARALAALRFSLESHLSGGSRCTDGTRWGHTWISALGVERMMYGVYLLQPWMSEADRFALRRVLLSEASWISDEMERHDHRGIVGGLWNREGRNVPESNLWNGALLWRTASMYPEVPQADHWREEAHRYLVNAVSIPADADDPTVVAGRPVKDRYAGPNFFPNYALDHHGYLNVGYMAICTSNAAMLHFDMKSQGLPRPETLDHHQSDLWAVLRRFVFGNGRLARIGGDSRVRYAYCQEYLVPSLLYAADRWKDGDATFLARRLLKLMDREQAAGEDGSFYGKRLAHLAEESPYYYTRLESDRACVLGMLCAWSHLVERPPEPENPSAHFERSTSGTWWEPQHGAILHRCPTRLASFAWRAYGLTQGMCQPPGDGDLAEWDRNLSGVVRFLGDEGATEGGYTKHRELLRCEAVPFDGGFATCGAVQEGMDINLAEGWRGTESALHQIAFVALPDAHTAVGLEFCRTADRRTYTGEVKGLHLNLPNDLYNGNSRNLLTAGGEIQLRSPAPIDEVVDLRSRWVSVEGKLSAVGLYGAEGLSVHRSAQRRGGRYRSLHVEEICWPCKVDTSSLGPATVVLDSAWAVLSSVDAGRTAAWAESNADPLVRGLPESLRAVTVEGLDGVHYLVAANFGEEDEELAPKRVKDQIGRPLLLQPLPGARKTGERENLPIRPCQARVWRIR